MKSFYHWKNFFTIVLQDDLSTEEIIDFLEESTTTVEGANIDDVEALFVKIFEFLDKVRDRINKDEMLKEIQEQDTAPSVIYQPGSKWAKPEGKWGPDKKTLFQEIKKYRVNNRVVLPEKKKGNEWKIICSQLGEFRKDELIHIAWELDIGALINPRWNKFKICEFMSKYIKSASQK